MPGRQDYPKSSQFHLSTGENCESGCNYQKIRQKKISPEFAFNYAHLGNVKASGQIVCLRAFNRLISPAEGELNQVTTTLHGLIHWIMGSITGSGIVGVANLVVGVGLAVCALIRKFRKVKAWSLNLSGNDGAYECSLRFRPRCCL